MAAPHMSPPRTDTPVPPASGDVVVPLRPKPPAYPAISPVARPVIIEQDVIDYLVKVPLDQRWRILSRVAMATYDEPAPASVAPPPPPPSSPRPQLELVDQTRETAPVAHETPAPTATVPAPPPSVPRPTSAPPPRASATPAPRASAPPPPPAPKPAAEQAEELFEVMHELSQREDALSGARFCLDVALASVPSLAALVHVRDPKSLELVVGHAQGPRAENLLRTRTLPIDPLAIRASRAGKPVVATYGAEPDAEKTACPRHAFFDPWSVVVVPVMHAGQLLGLIEMIDPIDGNPRDEQAQSSLAYIAECLAKFLVEHPAAPIAP
jgi:hypothetical protein